MNFSQALHLQLIENIWQYDLYAKLNGEVNIPLGSLTYMIIMLKDLEAKKISNEINFFF